MTDTDQAAVQERSLPSPGRQMIMGLAGLTAILVIIVAISLTRGDASGVRVDVLSPRRAEPGEVVPIKISIRDTRGIPRQVRVEFGDGDIVLPEFDAGECPAEGRAGSVDIDLTHTYPDRGVYTVLAEVETGGCGAPSEHDTAVRTIEVKPLRR